MARAEVMPFFPQHHSDVAEGPQTQAVTIHPEGFAARGGAKQKVPNFPRPIVREVPFI